MLVRRVFSGEPMLSHPVFGASKVAVVRLCDRTVEAGVVIIDTEEASEHMAQFGQVAMPLRRTWLRAAPSGQPCRAHHRPPTGGAVGGPAGAHEHGHLDSHPALPAGG